MRAFRQGERNSWFDDLGGLAWEAMGEVRSLACVRWPGGSWCSLLAGDQAGRIHRLDLELDRLGAGTAEGTWTTLEGSGEGQLPQGPVEALQPVELGEVTDDHRWIAVGSHLGGLGWLKILPPTAGAGTSYHRCESCSFEGVRALAWHGGTLWVASSTAGLHPVTVTASADERLAVCEAEGVELPGTVRCLALYAGGDQACLVVGTRSARLVLIDLHPQSGVPLPGQDRGWRKNLDSPARSIAFVPSSAPDQPRGGDAHPSLVVATAFGLRWFGLGENGQTPASGELPTLLMQRGELRHLSIARTPGWWLLTAATDRGVELQESPELRPDRAVVDWQARQWLPLSEQGEPIFRILATPLTGGQPGDVLLLLGGRDGRLRCVVRRGHDGQRRRRADEILDLIRGAAAAEGGGILGTLLATLRHHPFDREVAEGCAAWLAGRVDAWQDQVRVDSWEVLERTVCELALHSTPQTLRDLIRAIQHLMHDCTLDQTTLARAEDLLRFIKRYCQPDGRYGDLEGGLLELARKTERSLPFDSQIHLGVLASRGIDIRFRGRLHSTDPGEPSFFTPIWVKRDGECPSHPHFLLGTRVPGVLFAVSWDGGVSPKNIPTGRHFVRNLYIGATRIYLFTTGDEVVRIETESLYDAQGAITAKENIQGETVARGLHVHTVCPADADPRRGSDAFLWGGADGTIGLFEDGRFLAPTQAFNGDGIDILDLRSFRWEHDGCSAFLLAAACSDGHVRLLEVQRPGDGKAAEFVEIAKTYLDPHDVVTLTPERGGLLVAATRQGYIYGLRLLPPDSSPDFPSTDRPRMLCVWNYRTGGEVHSLRWFKPLRERVCILAGSMDEHLHVLDRSGNQVNTVFARGLPVARFWVTPVPESPSQDDILLGHVRIVSYTNDLVGADYLRKRALMEECRDQKRWPFASTTLLRLRTVALSDPFFRVSWCLLAPELEDTELLLGALERLPGAPVDAVTTSHFVGLIRRLFRPGWIEKLLPDGAPEDAPYLRAMRVLEVARGRWGLKDEHDNGKVQLYWLRSLLRGLRDARDFNTWWDRSKEIGPEVAAGALLNSYLKHDAPVLRFKAVEYIERLLFGRGDGDGAFVGILWAEADAGQAHLAVDRILGALLDSVGGGKFDLRGDAYWIIDRICALLARMLHRGPDTLCPCDLVVHVRQQAGVSEFYQRLADVVAGFDYPEGHDRQRSDRWAALIRNSRHMIDRLDHFQRGLPAGSVRQETSALRGEIKHFLGYCEDCQAEHADLCPRNDLRKEARKLLGAVDQMLSLEEHEALRSADVAAGMSGRLGRLVGEWKAYPERPIERSVAPLLRLLAHLTRYAKVARDDILGPFTAFHAGHFLAMESESRRAEDIIKGEVAADDRFVPALFQAVRRSWEHILEEQRERGLMLDFQRGLLQTEVGETGTLNLNAEPADHDLDYHNAFVNLFQRLFAAGSADRGLLLLYDRGREEVRLFRLDRESWQQGYEDQQADEAQPPVPQSPLEELPKAEREHWPVPLAWRGREDFLKAALEQSAELCAMQGIGWSAQHPIPLVERHRILRIVDNERVSYLEFVNHGIMWFGWREAREVPPQLTTLPSGFVHGLALGHAYQENIRFQNRVFKIVSHNFRNPVVNIVQNIGLALDTKSIGWPGRAELLDRARHQGRRIRGITDSVLCLSGRPLDLDPLDFDLCQVVDAAVKAARFFAAHSGLSVAAFEPFEAPIRSDEGKVYEVISLVLDNAIKYTEARKRKKRLAKVGAIQVTVTAGRGAYEVVIEDDGIGVDKDEAKDLFRPFARSSRATEFRVDGLGIGLFTCELYLDAIGGRIKLRPIHEDRGTRCTIYLPRRCRGE